MLIPLNRKEVLQEITELYPAYNGISAYFDTDSKNLLITFPQHMTKTFKVFDRTSKIVKRSPGKYGNKVYYSLVRNNEITLDATIEYIKSFGMDLTFECLKDEGRYISRYGKCFYNIVPDSEEAHAMFTLYFYDHIM